MLARNVLIFHSGALGDFVLTWPLAVALGRLFPQSRIMYVAAAQKGVLAEAVLRVEWLDAENDWHHLYGDAAKLPEAGRKKVEQAHTIIAFGAGEADSWVANVRGIAPKADIIPISMKPNDGSAEHVSNCILKSLKARPVIAAAVTQILSSVADRGLGNYQIAADGPIAIHPGSGSREKCWPVESYLQLADRLGKSGAQCKIILGEVELERWPVEVVRRIESCAETVRPGTHIELLGQLKSSRGFVGNDSGPAHLAGIIGLPTLAIFGPTDPVIWKPLGPKVMTLRDADLSRLTAADVMARLNQAGV